MISLSLAAGLKIEDWDNFTIGEISEIIIERFNLMNEFLGTSSSSNNKTQTVRRATQDDWDKFSM